MPQLRQMNKTAIKTKRGKSKVKVAEVELTKRPLVENDEKIGIPAYLEPTEYDLHDELSRLDSFNYSKYN